MMDALLDADIAGGPVVAGLYAATGIVVLALMVFIVRRSGRRRLVLTVAGTVAVAAAGWLLAWLFSDVWDVFGVSLSNATRMWVAAFFACLALAASGFAARSNRPGNSRPRPLPLTLLAVITVPLALLSAAAGINADFGQYPTLRSALGIPVYGPLDQSPPRQTTILAHGTVGSVTIPATVSGFAARDAMVYLPPVAGAADPPALPVIEMLSGQPGSPQDVFTAGHLAEILDEWAAGHNGLAPIVVVPDQLGAPEKNPMCVDSSLGRSATYLTVDVPAWIRAHFAVASARSGWAIAGFSQGGTCSIQLGAAHPELYGTIFDISGELAPSAGGQQHTIQTGFGGSATRYAAAAPAAILAAHAPYADLTVLFAVGGDDDRYLPWSRTLADAATVAGADVRLIVSPGTAHDWATVRYAWTSALPTIMARLGQ